MPFSSLAGRAKGYQIGQLRRCGGVFSVVVGCALIGTLLNAFTIMDVNSEVQNIIRGVVLLVAIIVDNWLHPRDEETARQGD
jgi:ribose transport system permease protein